MRAESRLALALALALASTPAFADWKRDYALGERAVRAEDWAEAEARFRQAAREEPAPSDRKRFEGVVFRDYAPQFWAGFAAWKQGECERAMDYWRDGANDPAVLAKIKDFKAQQDRAMAECSRQLAANTPAPAPAQPPAAATPPVADVPTPARPAQPAGTPASTGQAPSQAAPVAPTVASTSTSRPAPQPATTAPAPTPASTGTPATAAPAASAAPALLVGTVEAWLAGRSAEVLRADPTSVADGRARAQLHLFRAAARHAEAELVEGDDSRFDAAREDVRAARRALATLSPDATLFSPRFRSFWQQTR